MYHCMVKGYLVSAPSDLCDLICNTAAPEHYKYSFSCSESINADILKNATLIIAFWDDSVSRTSGYNNIEDWINALIKGKKRDADLILCVPPDHSEEILQKYSDSIFDIWKAPISLAEAKYRFSNWQKMDKNQKEKWISDQYLDTLIDSVPHLIWYKDKAGAHLKVNDSFCKAVNKTKEQIKGRGHLYIWDLDPEEYASGEFICMESEDEVMEKKKTIMFEENVKIGDEMRQLDTYKSPLFDLDGSVMGTVGLANDVTKEKRYEAMILKQANTDALTGLYNRRYLVQYIESKAIEPTIFYYLDLDNFKGVNDRYGHQAGDQALILAAESLKKEFEGALIARIGGDEFLVVLFEEMNAAAVEEERLHMIDILNNAFAQDEKFKTVSASIGTAYSPAGVATDTDALMESADNMMYQEKKQKKRSR